MEPDLHGGTRIAVLIDADNTSPKYAEALLEEVAKYGTPTIKRAYGDFSSSRLTGWTRELNARAIRGTLHCDFSPEELATAFDDLVAWVETGQRPVGDDVLDPNVVADPRYGCRFTRGAHPYFTAEIPCP